MGETSVSFARMRIVALLYAVLVILLATLTALGTHLQPSFVANTPIYIAYVAVHLYLNGVSILFILCLLYVLHCTRIHKVMLPVGSELNRTSQPVSVILKNAPPISRYQRSAIICFGLTGVVLDGIRIVEAITDKKTLECAGLINIVGSGFRLALTLCLIAFILGHHKTIINRNISLLKWGIVHLITTMLADYITLVIVEAYEGFVHGGGSHQDDHNSSNTTEVPHHVKKRASEGTCIYNSSLLSNRLMPYMLPFIIEFALLSGATLYKIFGQIGVPVTEEMLIIRYIPIADKMKLMFKRLVFPSMIGLSIFFVTLGGTIYFIYTDSTAESSTDDLETSAYIFFLMQIVLNVFGVIIMSFAFIHLSAIPFTGHIHSFIDQAVLIITMFGFYLLIGFNILPNLTSFGSPDFLGTLSRLGTFENLTNYIEGSMQFLFIMDAMRRASQPMWLKYTRAPAFVLVLFYINVSLWLITSFLVKETQENILMVNYYGPLTWNIVLFATLPLAIFFRFHSTVCLVDILVEIWMPDKLGKD